MAGREVARRQYRFSRRTFRWFTGPIFVFAGLIFAIIMVAASLDAGWPMVAVGAVFCCYSFWVAWRVMRLNVQVDAQGVTVRNLGKTRRLEWSQVRGVRRASEDRSSCVRILLTDGSSVKCHALSPSVTYNTTRLDQLADGIQQAIDELRPDPLSVP